MGMAEDKVAHRIVLAGKAASPKKHAETESKMDRSNAMTETMLTAMDALKLA